MRHTFIENSEIGHGKAVSKRDSYKKKTQQVSESLSHPI